ncbi:MAG: tRNA (adenosine(37)-N6)-threonylcarbamoyltransferase complex dimerization subunit type 1 TsaB [Pseudomonadota bacterium]
MILGIDTAAGRCAVALMAEGRVVAARAERLSRGHAERLFPMIEVVLSEAGLAFEALTRVATCTGPGSFTGIRAGVAAARGLAVGAGIPAVGITRFEALAAGIARPAITTEPTAPTEASRPTPIRTAPRRLEEKVGWAERRPLAVAIAGRGTVYLQLFKGDIPAAPPAVLAPEALAAAVPSNAVPVGDGWAVAGVDPAGPGGRGEPVLRPEGFPDPAMVALLGGEIKDPRPPAPLYLRGADAAMPREAPPRRLG